MGKGAGQGWPKQTNFPNKKPSEKEKVSAGNTEAQVLSSPLPAHAGPCLSWPLCTGNCWTMQGCGFVSHGVLGAKALGPVEAEQSSNPCPLQSRSCPVSALCWDPW